MFTLCRWGFGRLKICVAFCWYDCWVGAYWDRKDRVFYVCPLPMFVIGFRRIRTLGDFVFPKDLEYPDTIPAEKIIGGPTVTNWREDGEGAE